MIATDRYSARSKELPHRVRHSPTGFEWGYGGSGPADLARSILWDHLGLEPASILYQRFKQDWVSKWPKSGFTIDSQEIDEWLSTQEIAVVCVRCGLSAKWEYVNGHGECRYCMQLAEERL